MSETTLSLGDDKATTGTPCPRCNVIRIGDPSEHLCPDLDESLGINPLKMEIDVEKITILLSEIQTMSKQLEDLFRTADSNTVAKLDTFRDRLTKCEFNLQKQYAHYAPYCLNGWDAMITKLETAAKILEKRTLEK